MNKKVISLPSGALPHTKALVFGGASLKHQTRQESKNKILKNDYSLINRCINIVEQFSRNLVQDIDTENRNSKNIIITGFDPYNMGEDIDINAMDNNPSGDLALFLHNKELSSFKVHTAIFPVRYEDFDNNILEIFLNQFAFQVDAVFTVSLTPRSEIIRVDKYAANNRTGAKDNNGLSKSGTIINNGNSFLESSLPYENTIDKTYSGYKVILENSIESKEKGSLKISNINEVINDTPVRGSGGGYLSNEIFYRACKWRNDTKPLSFIPNLKRVVNGHIHIADVNKENYEKRMQVYSAAFSSIVSSIIENL